MFAFYCYASTSRNDSAMVRDGVQPEGEMIDSRSLKEGLCIAWYGLTRHVPSTEVIVDPSRAFIFHHDSLLSSVFTNSGHDACF